MISTGVRSHVGYRVEHSKRNSISPRAHELFSIYLTRIIKSYVFSASSSLTSYGDSISLRNAEKVGTVNGNQPLEKHHFMVAKTGVNFIKVLHL